MGQQNPLVLQAPAILKTILTPPAQMVTKLAVSQGPAGAPGQDATNFTGDPLAYYILAKS
ncbi:MAG: hypothetical protein K2X63_10305 [Burkholderiaceae bacterium]|nr:hypothetical protein [Burkholderiaceae bacterium]